jgi:hypothetical protein
LDSFVRIGAFQWVTGNPQKKISTSLPFERRPVASSKPQLARTPRRRSLNANLAFPADTALYQKTYTMDFGTIQ